MVQVGNLIDGLKPTLMMVVVQVVYSGTNVLYKLAAADGMSLTVIPAYRFIFAAAFITPLALIVERKSWTKLTWKILFQAFVSGLLGATMYQNLYLESLVMTSATFAAAMTNFIPAVTFILAITFGLEKVGLRSASGKAKVCGTILGVGGAMLFSFCKGMEINVWSTNIDVLKQYDHQGSRTPHENHIIAGLSLAILSCFTFAAWLIVQATISIKFPYPYSSTALMCVMASIQSTAYALCIEKDRSQWKLGWNIRLLTVAYSGILVSGLMTVLCTWCIQLRGPLFVSIFSPLLLVCVAVEGSLLLEEKFHLGSALGGILIVCGLYAVTWGKRQETKKISPPKGFSESEKVEIIVTTSPTQSNSQIDENKSCSINNKDEKMLTADK
ncbi:hypothetical protein K2173_015460 [Erythroxylum novogranatense]|uniref:WAT1-related protein n=1 Tax=Erythroxylum novogranatense TaxID=1862640 RepID=A0AAV8SRT7_9ROSI|nr:hypothetical protein K2173_015460 [Erythroxylum novogranatense]